MREYLYVENTSGGDVTVISIPQHEVVGTIPATIVGGHPDDVVASPDGRMLFINRLEGQDVVALDARTEQVLFTVPLGGVPHHMTISRDGRFLYVPMFNGSVLKVIDLTRREVVREIDIGLGAHATRLSPDGRRLYVGHIVHQAVMIIDLARNEVVQTINFDRGVRPFAISPDETTLYVQTSNMSGFHVVDIATGRIMQTVNMPTAPQTMPTSFPHTVDHGLALTRDGRRLLAAGALSGRIAIFSVPDMRVIADIPVGREPNWITLSDDERFAYVSNRVDDTISVISMDTFTEIKRLPAGDLPQRMTTARVDRLTEAQQDGAASTARSRGNVVDRH
ncbi:beta-propeller fold lactonase family protein [Sphingosinicella sp. LHD-64]|uniref:YVTN family beta-propeller repeat protein n=1 Tax=Sphingosinicella sp. LHD-64 TaxID=3072139 RepID=UPI0028102D88|nr:beta-propeller fold lactonase family protein [Sphingosinicella sp. LHD-64]MDQ8756233.1 beta-propeller fold lactonase family protein [Sphingosinicella sp. LHD-64]